MFVQLVAGLALCSIAVATDTQPLPIVDLRYDRHQASFNVSFPTMQFFAIR